MKKLVYAFFAMFLTLGFGIEEAEAKRLGGGKSFGAQRQAVTPEKATPPAAAPTQTAPSQAAAPAAAQPKPGMGRWLAPLAGLAAGLGLAALFGEQMGTILMAMLAAIAVVLVVAFLMRALRPRPQGAPQPLQYAGIGNETVAAPPPSQPAGADALPTLRTQFSPRIPEGFDSAGFLREAKRRFIELQAANDRGDLEAIRDFVDDELFEVLARDVGERGGNAQQTDIVTLNADLLEVVTENDAHWASIRFSGMLREDAGGAPTPFEEIWNLQKPVHGNRGWMLAGIQQIS